jgi:hypothetical protein
MSERNYCLRKSLLRVPGREGVNVWKERKEEGGAIYALYGY